jgi:hypothetical protein
MAYNTKKGSQHTGDIQYEGDPNDVQIDFENDQIILKTGGAPRVNVTNTELSASGIFRVNGSISGSGDVAISGTMNATSIYATIGRVAAAFQAGTISGSGILQVATAITSSGDIVGSGSVHATSFYGDGSTLTGVGAMDSIGLRGTDGPTQTITNGNTIFIEAGSGISTTAASGDKVTIAASGTVAQLTTGVETSGYLKVSGSSTLNAITATTISASSTLQTVGATTLGSTLNVSGNTSLGITGSLVPLHVNGATQQILISTQQASIVRGTSISQINMAASENSSNFYTGAKIEALGDHTWDLANNSSPTRLTLSTVPSGSSNARSRISINNSGTVGIGDNFSPTSNALLHVSASEDQYNLYVSGGMVGIGTSTPGQQLTVAGNMSGSGTLQTVGAATFSSTIAATGSVSAVGLYSTDLISGSMGIHVDMPATFGGEVRVTGAAHLQAATVFSGSIYRPNRTVRNSNYTLTATDNIVFMNTNSATLTASLPVINSVTDGIQYTIKNIGTNSMVITSPVTIDGQGALTGSLGKAWTMVADGDVWIILSSHQG